MSAPDSPGRWTGIGVAFLVLLFLLQSFTASRLKGPTSDETYHIAAGMSYVATGRIQLNRQHPPLLKHLTGLSLAAAGLGFLAVTVPHAHESQGYSIATMIGFESVTIGAGFALFASGILRRGTICHGVVLGSQRSGPARRWHHHQYGQPGGRGRRGRGGCGEHRRSPRVCLAGRWHVAVLG